MGPIVFGWLLSDTCAFSSVSVWFWFVLLTHSSICSLCCVSVGATDHSGIVLYWMVSTWSQCAAVLWVPPAASVTWTLTHYLRTLTSPVKVLEVFVCLVPAVGLLCACCAFNQCAMLLLWILTDVSVFPILGLDGWNQCDSDAAGRVSEVVLNDLMIRICDNSHSRKR